MSLTFVTVCRSSNGKAPFNPLWVDRLNRQAREHFQPDRIVCLTDMAVTGCDVLTLPEGWPGWFAKLSLFRRGILEGPVVYLDLDSIILRPIPDFRARLDAALAECPLIMLSDLGVSHMPASGVMAWLPGKYSEQVYQVFAAKPRFYPSWDRGDGWHIGKQKHLRWQNIFPGTVASYRLAKLKDGPNGEAIVCWHGADKQHTLPTNNWAYRHWCGMPNTPCEPTPRKASD